MFRIQGSGFRVSNTSITQNQMEGNWKIKWKLGVCREVALGSGAYGGQKGLGFIRKYPKP